MAFLEHGSLCSFSEYIDNRGSRLLESDLTIGGLYTYMMKFKHTDTVAALNPARVQEIHKSSGCIAVQFAFLDDDLGSTVTLVERMSAGIIEPGGEKQFYHYENDAWLPIEEAYLRDYFDDGFGDLLKTSQELALT